MATVTLTTTMAASVAPYLTDNFTATTQSSRYRLPEDSLDAFNAWKTSLGTDKYYKTADANAVKYYRVASGSTPPAGSIAIDDTELQVVYASTQASLQQSLVDFTLSRAADEMLQKAGFAAANNLLAQIPEVDVNADVSSLSQIELLQLLKRLAQIGLNLKSTTAAGAARDQQSKALQLGLSVSLLSQSVALQATFDAQTQATPQLTDQPYTSGTDDALNNMFKSAIDGMVGKYQQNADAAKLAAQDSAFSAVSAMQLIRLASTALGALAKSLKAAADLGFLAATAELQFGRLSDVIQTADGFVTHTAAGAAREAKARALRAEIEAALNDPASISNLADALAANADNLGTSDLSWREQTQLYKEVAMGVIDAILQSPQILDAMAGEAVEAGTRFLELLNNEIESAANVENAEQQRFS